MAGVKVYRKFYAEAKEQAHGVLGIRVVRPAQKDPVNLLSDILNVSLLSSSLANPKSVRPPACPCGSDNCCIMRSFRHVSFIHEAVAGTWNRWSESLTRLANYNRYIERSSATPQITSN